MGLQIFKRFIESFFISRIYLDGASYMAAGQHPSGNGPSLRPARVQEEEAVGAGGRESQQQTEGVAGHRLHSKSIRVRSQVEEHAGHIQEERGAGEAAGPGQRALGVLQSHA